VLKHTTHTHNASMPSSVLFILSVNVCFYMHLWTGQLALVLFHRLINLNGLDLFWQKNTLQFIELWSVSFICDKRVTTQNLWFFRRNF